MSEDQDAFRDNQERVKMAHQKLKDWQTSKSSGDRLTGRQEGDSFGNGDQDRQTQDFDEIHLELGGQSIHINSSLNQDGVKSDGLMALDDPGNSSFRRKIVADEQYKQFYGGEEDPHAISIADPKLKGNSGLVLGAFQGVYLPVVTNILSVVLFLRINLIIGEAGIFQAFLILFFSTSTTFFTVLSMNAIITNGKIRTGGVYYLISRSLGPATGGSIGILYYFAITFSSAMSILGAVEAIHVVTNFSLVSRDFSMRFFSFALLAILVVVVLFGVRFVSRIGVAIIFLVFISILSIIIGLLSSKSRSDELQSQVPGLDGIDGQNFKDNWYSGYSSYSFMTLQALFFNACTGILIGTNCSNNLKDPINSIPKGTLTAHLSTTSLYILLFILFGCVGTRSALTDLSVIIAAEVAWPHRWVVYIGIILASSGSAMQQIQSAPLIICSIADDDMLPRVFNFLKGSYLKALCFTVILICISICFGSIDQAAPLVTIFFLLCYGGVNIACFLLDYLGSPNWRPKWRYYNKLTAFAGVVLCVASMVVISWWASIISIIGALLIYAYLDKKSQEKNWGDGVEGMRAERARNALLKINKSKKHVKNWRPHYLALGYINEKGKITSPGIFKLLHQLRKGTGLAIYGCVIKGDYTAASYEEARKKEQEIDSFMKKNKYNVFSKVIVSQNIEHGMVYLLQSSGLGGLEPNTILLSWPNQWEHDELKCNRFVNLINHSHTFGHLLTILKPQKAFDDDTKHEGTIDVWSFGFEKGMLLLFVQILIKSSHWKRCQVRLFIMTSLNETESETMKRVAKEYLDRYRLLNQNIYIEVVHVSSTMIEQFTFQLPQTIQNKAKVFQQAMQDKDFEYGTLPSLMKVKALQERENKMAMDNKIKRASSAMRPEGEGMDQDFDEKVANAKKINGIIKLKSQEASLVITNLPPILKEQLASEYMSFCSAMTEGLNRVLLIQNSSQEVLTHYS